MTAVIWVLTWLPQVLSAMSELPKPDNVKMNSTNFIHVLSWESGPGTPSGVHYQVSVHSVSGRSWEPVAGCQHVELPLACNVTEAFPDPREGYITQVVALLGARVSQPAQQKEFVPIRQTHLDFPRLTVTPCGRSLCVGLHPPVERLREIYDSLQYTLHVNSGSAGAAQVFKDTRSLKGEVLKDLAPGRRYCVSVRFSDSLVNHKFNYSQPQCVFTAGAHTADPVISTVLSSVLVVGLVVVVLALLVRTGFICLREPLPLVLTSIHHMEEVLVAEPCSTCSYSPVHFERTPPSTGGTGNNRALSDDSEGETETESSAGIAGGEGGYEVRGATNLLSASSCSSSSLPSPLSPEPGPLPNSVFLPSEELEPQPGAAISTDIHSVAGSNPALTTPTTSHSVSLPKSDQHAPGH
uniref:interferon alpha/beta receptor 2-like n=1 Tax=Centroberyx gerrardi TaxID=166262 RepID=UPI003AAA5952